MRRDGRRPRVLLLGGTLEARELAEHLEGEAIDVVSSLAGATATSAAIPGEVRRGGFGGTEGLAAYIAAGGFTAVIDATHPFARRIQEAAVSAAAATGVPLLRLERPAWTPEAGDRWHHVGDLGQAVALLPQLGRRVLVTLGRRLAAELPGLERVSWLVRSIEPPGRLPAQARWIEGRPPFTQAQEQALLEREAIEVILAKASGGEGARAKLVAARQLGLPVILLERPPPALPAPTLVDTIEAALRWFATVAEAGGNARAE